MNYEKDNDEWRYQFVLPKTYSLDNAPRPLNADVTLAETVPFRRNEVLVDLPKMRGVNASTRFLQP